MKVTQRSNFRKHTNSNPLQRYLLDRFHGCLAELLNGTGTNLLLDAGCGEGFVTHYLLQNRNGLRVWGLDIDRDALQYHGQQNPKNTLFQGDIYHLPFADNAFPLVMCTEVLEHLEKPVEALREIERVTSQYALISVPNEPFFRLANFLRGKNLTAWGNDVGHLHNWTTTDFRHLLETAFDIAETHFPFPWSLALCRKHGA